MKEALKLALEAWKNAAIRLGEELSSVGPDGYYDMTAQQWLDWAMEQEPRGKNSLAQPEQEPVFKWCSVFQEMPTKDSHLLFCFGVHVVEGSYTKKGWASLAYGEAQPDFWAYMPPPPHHKRNQELYAMPPKRPWVGLTDAEKAELWGRDAVIPFSYADAIEAKLKEKDT